MPLFNRRRDIKLFNSVNKELMNRIITTPVALYKINPKSDTNIYGESPNKTYSDGIVVSTLIDHDEQMTETEQFGQTVLQNVRFSFHRGILAERQIYPEVGDIVEWNESFFEINSVIENQMPGGQMYNIWSVVAMAHMVSRDKLNIEKVRVGK